MSASLPSKPPTAIEAIFNRVFAWFVGVGLAPAPFYVLDVLLRGDRRYLVAPRGHTQWVRNAKASGTVTLRRGRIADRYILREVEGREKAEVLKAYLETFRRQVQRFFPVPAGSPAEQFVPLADRYPVFELTAQP